MNRMVLKFVGYDFFSSFCYHLYIHLMLWLISLFSLCLNSFSGLFNGSIKSEGPFDLTCILPSLSNWQWFVVTCFVACSVENMNNNISLLSQLCSKWLYKDSEWVLCQWLKYILKLQKPIIGFAAFRWISFGIRTCHIYL
jgi:hypothetical protein